MPYPFRIAFYFTLLLWLSFILSRFSFSYLENFLQLGIIPRNQYGILGIFVSPFIHADLNHILSNQFIFIHLVILSLVKPKNEVWVIVLLIISTGILVWLFGSKANHVGVSGLIFALQGFNLITSFRNRNVLIFFICLIIILFESSFIYGLFGWLSSKTDNTSYASHIWGFVSGVSWSLIMKNKPSS